MIGSPVSDAQKVRVVGCGVNLEHYPSIDRAQIEGKRDDWNFGNYEMNALFLSRLQKGKGVFDVVDAVIKLNTSGRKIQLLVAGADYASNSIILEKISRRYPFIRYLGRVSEGEKISLLHACDVLVVPSIMESFGIVYIEAWACGKPVIGADIPSTRSLISSGKDGFYIEYGDRHAIAEQLAYLADNPITRVAMGSRGYTKVKESYTDEKVLEATFRIYDEISAGRLE